MVARDLLTSRAWALLLLVATAIAVGFGLYTCVLAEPALGTLDGVLIARDSGRPVAANVTISGREQFSTESDRQGRFQFAEAPVGLYQLEAASPGHALVKQMVWVTEGRSQSTYFEMARRPSWVQLVLHTDVLYPGEPVSIAVSGLTLEPSYQLDVYRVQRWSYVREYDAIEHSRALARAAEDMMAVPCWSSWKTGISSIPLSVSSI